MGLDIARIRAICFDIDGTLIDTDDAYVERLAGWFARLGRLGFSTNPHSLARRVVMAAETPINALVTWMDWLHLDQILGPGMDALHRVRGVSPRARSRLIPGARSALERLARYYPLAVVTAREQSSAMDVLRSHALLDHFACITTARSARRAKPHPGPILWTAAQLGCPPHSLLMVGDTAMDILSGRRAGAQTAGLLCGFGRKGELLQAGADMLFPEPSALAEHLLGAGRSLPETGLDPGPAPR